MTERQNDGRPTVKMGLRNIPKELETPHGVLYGPKPFWLQGVLLFGAFAGGPFLGRLLGMALGGVSEGAQLFLYVPPILIFFVGYAVWSARLAAIVFDAFGRRILWALIKSLIRRKRPEGFEDALPSADNLREMAVRAQKAASSFLVVAVPIAGVSGLLAALMQTRSAVWFTVSIVTAAGLLWGWLLAFLARRGYLPLPDTE